MIGAVVALVLIGIGIGINTVFGTPTAPKPSIKAEPLFDVNLGPAHFPFTNSMLMTLIVGGLLVLFFALATRRMQLVPGRTQNLAETAVEGLLGLVEGVAGKRTGRVIFPLIATLFIFILMANYLALLPGVGSIGVCRDEAAVHGTAATHEGEGTTAGTAEEGQAEPTPLAEGETHAEEGGATAAEEAHSPVCPAGQIFVPFLRAPNADLNMTLAMALIAVTIVQIAGVVAHGPGGYVKELFTPIFLGPVHIIGELSRVISLSARLFGNIFGGEVLLLVMYFLLGSIAASFGVVIFLGLELLFGGIQALLFSMLTLTYIALAVAGHGPGHEGGEHHEAAHGPGGEVVDQPKTGTEVHMG
jgi:F-type H+-transporting ATPase subunit a